MTQFGLPEALGIKGYTGIYVSDALVAGREIQS